MTRDERETWKEHQERLYAMAVDDGETWDLSENDQAACNAGGDAIMALLDRAALAPAPACGTWQTIATAPRVGEVLLWWPHWSHRAMVGYWKFSKWIGENALSDTEHDPGPTHWMPLPNPPTEPTR